MNETRAMVILFVFDNYCGVTPNLTAKLVTSSGIPQRLAISPGPVLMVHLFLSLLFFLFSLLTFSLLLHKPGKVTRHPAPTHL